MSTHSASCWMTAPPLQWRLAYITAHNDMSLSAKWSWFLCTLRGVSTMPSGNVAWSARFHLVCQMRVSCLKVSTSVRSAVKASWISRESHQWGPVFSLAVSIVFWTGPIPQEVWFPFPGPDGPRRVIHVLYPVVRRRHGRDVWSVYLPTTSSRKRWFDFHSTYHFHGHVV